MEINDRKRGQPIIEFRELVTSENGKLRRIGLTNVDVQPLGYAELAAARLDKKMIIPFEGRNAEIVETDIESLSRSNRYRVSATLESRFTSLAIGLVRGGWLPSSLAARSEHTTVLVDRNVVSHIASRFDGNVKAGLEPDFIDLFANRPVRISPVLFALEGNVCEIPTAQIVASQLSELEDKIKRALPKAVVATGPHIKESVCKLIEESRKSAQAKQRFLVQVVPGIAAPVSRSKFDAKWNEIVKAADDCNVARSALVVLAVLCAIAKPSGKNPAKKLLKPSAQYSPKDAYNAFSDIRALEILIMLFGSFPEDSLVLCTADRALGLFWSGIRASNIVRSPETLSFNINPVHELFPIDLARRWQRDIAAGQSFDIHPEVIKYGL